MVKKISFENSFGEKLSGVFSVPTTSQKDKVFIISNGFPSTKESPTYLDIEKKVNKIGIATLRYDYSGTGESEGKMENFSILRSVNDLEAGIHYLRSIGIKHIALGGFSYGGIVSIIVASKDNSIEALFLKSPVTNYEEQRVLTNHLAHDNKWKDSGFIIEKDRQGNTYRIPYLFFQELVKIDGRKLASEINCPTLIIHGSADSAIPVIQSEKLAEIMPEARLAVISGADHHYSRAKDYAKSLDLMSDFIRKWA